MILSIGSRGPEVGAVFDLMRAGNEFVGEIVITSVEGKRAEGLFDTRDARAAGFPRKGDRAFFWDGEMTSGLEARVNAVKGDLVSISAGAKYKVRVGDHFNLFRQWSWTSETQPESFAQCTTARYVGRIRITQVDDDPSAGVFDTEDPGGAAPPQVGDRATPGG